MSSEKHKEITRSGEEYYVIAIGASAGGLEAINEFFDNMPANDRMAFIIIQHLSPQHKSLLVELIAKHTSMRVSEAQHGEKVTGGSVYVIPNNKVISIQEGRLLLEEKSFIKAPNTAIDIFLKSLAEDRKQHSVAVILSGTGSDGSRGIQYVRANGGLVLAQDPTSAQFDGMPHSAIATGLVDYILPPELMPDQIFTAINEKPLHPRDNKGEPSEADLRGVLKLVERNCQHDFTDYKSGTLLRRISRRMNSLGVDDFKEYYRMLETSTEECRFLGKDFLIGVTKFFRDLDAFNALQKQVLEPIIRQKPEGEFVKVWVTACSTGQEVYSIAMLLNELIEQSGKNLEMKLFATDIDAEAIEIAAKGTYTPDVMADVPTRLKEKYFTAEERTYTVQPFLRQQIVFARHNVLKDPPFIRNDLVTCRNMLIYMNSGLQAKVMTTLRFALNGGGYLFLGPSEVPAGDQMLEAVDLKWKIYRKLDVQEGYNPERLPSVDLRTRNRIPAEVKKATALELLFKDTLVRHFGFAAILLDRNFEVKEAIGDYRKYLSLPEGAFSLNILRMVPAELSISIAAAVRRCLKEKKEVTINQVLLSEAAERVQVFISPMMGEGQVMLLLARATENLHTSAEQITPVQPVDSAYVRELQEELRETRSNLQMAVEGLETANEELQSSNEELLSANEELQSSNEELQSLNEELHTLNTEHQLRIKELLELNDDLNNYFRSTDIAQIFLDRNLRVRKFNPSAQKIINLIEDDIGRPIQHISSNIIDSPHLVEDIRSAIETNTKHEQEVHLNNGNTLILRIYPYVRKDSVVDGAVITVYDITHTKELDTIVKAVYNATISAKLAFRSQRDRQGIIVDFELISANHAAEPWLGRKPEDAIGGKASVAFPLLTNADLFQASLQVIRTNQHFIEEIYLEHGPQTGWFDFTITPMMDGVVVSILDINDKKNAEAQFRQNYEELMVAKESLNRLNQELEQKVRQRTQELSLSEERFRIVASAASNAVYDRDLSTGRIWWSDSVFRWLGYPSESELQDSSFWLDLIHADDRRKVEVALAEALDEKKSWQQVYRLKKSSGEYVTVEDKGTIVYSEDDIPHRLIGALTDLSMKELEEQNRQLLLNNQELEKLVQQRTADLEAQALSLKKANQELQRVNREFQFVTDFMPQLVWATQKDGYHEFYNKRWYEYTGLNAEDSFGEGWNRVLHPEDKQRAQQVWQYSLRTGKPYEIEYRFRKYDGEYRWFLGRALPFKDEQGNIIKWFGTCTDINDQKMANDLLEKKVRERTEDLETANTELMQFASIASHDLKEPLRKIVMFSNVLNERYSKELSPEAVAHLKRIINSSSRMNELVHDLLSFTRLTSSEALFETVDLDEILEQVLSDLELTIQEKKAEVVIQDNLPVMEIVPAQMRQVFQNLIANSLKFCRPGVAPRVQIHCMRVAALTFIDAADKNGQYCRITVQDNGIGFDNTYADKIFTIFQRLNQRDVYDGTGIGLAIVKKIIVNHGGIIRASGEEGKGASFQFVLPLKRTY